MGKLSGIILGLFVLVGIMLSTYTFIGGFSAQYNLTETEDYADEKYDTFHNMSGNIYDYSVETQTSVQNVTAAGGEESSLVAGLWVIPQALGMLIKIPEIIYMMVSTVTHLGDSAGVPIPDWVSLMLAATIIVFVALAIGSIIWKYEF